MNRAVEWGVVITTVLSVLSIVPRHRARLTDFLRPKSRNSNAVLITVKLMTHPLRHLRCAVRCPMAWYMVWVLVPYHVFSMLCRGQSLNSDGVNCDPSS